MNTGATRAGEGRRERAQLQQYKDLQGRASTGF